MTYGTVVLADAPVHFWRLADPGGAVLHDIGSSPRALEIGAGNIGPVTPYMGPASDGGAAYLLQNQALNYQDADLLIAQPCSLEIWFWLHSLRGVAQGFLALTDGVSNLEIGVDNALKVHAFGSGGGLTAAAATTRQQWHHLVLTATVAANNMYLDAINVATLVGGAIPVWHPGFIVGAGGSTTAPLRFSTAALAEAAIYATALTPGQVTNHYLAADNIAARPVYRNSGTWSVTTGSSQTVTEQIGTLVVPNLTRDLRNAP